MRRTHGGSSSSSLLGSLATGPMSSSVADLIAHLAVPSEALEAAEGLGAMVSMKDLGPAKAGVRCSVAT